MKWQAKPMRPLRNEVKICVCGGKYLKTRDRQRMCLMCITKERAAR